MAEAGIGMQRAGGERARSQTRGGRRKSAPVSLAEAKPFRRIPRVPGAPLVGVLPDFFRDAVELVSDAAPRHGYVVRLPLGPIRAVVLSHPDDLQYVLRDNHANYRKGPVGDAFRRISGDALVNLEPDAGDVWIERRKLMQPHFHGRRLGVLGDAMSKAIESQIPVFERHAETGETLDLMRGIRDITVRVFMMSFFGTMLDDERATRLGDALGHALGFSFRRQRVSMLPMWTPMPGKRKFEESLATLRGITLEIIEQKRREADESGDLLSFLVHARGPRVVELSNEELLSEAIALIIGGWETSSATLGWIFLELMRHPDARERLIEEYRVHLSGRSPRLEDVAKLEFSRMVMNESLRLNPIAHTIPRQVIEDDVVGGYVLKRNTLVMLSVRAVHRDPAWWDEPLRFHPDRFADGVMGATHHRFAYLPFSAGPRQCIGDDFAQLEIQMVMGALWQRFHFEVVPGFELEINKDATYTPETLPVKVTRQA